MSSHSNDTGKSRRNFLKKLFIGFGALIAAEAAALFLSFVGKSKKEELNAKNAKYLPVGKIEDFQVSSVTPFRAGRFYLVRLADGGFLALSIVCPHLGCSVSWNEKEGDFVCPCHASKFNINGAVLNPPAARPLDTYPVRIENKVVQVSTSEAIKRKSISTIPVVYPES